MVALLSGIFGLITIGVTIWWALYQRDKSPLQQNRERYEQIDKDIARRNSLAATANADADLDELDRLQNNKGNPSRPS